MHIWLFRLFILLFPLLVFEIFIIFLHLSHLISLPFRTPLLKNTFEQLRSWLYCGMLGTPGLSELSFNSCFQDSGTVAFELGFGSLQCCYTCIQAGELLFDGCYDATLFGKRWKGIEKIA